MHWLAMQAADGSWSDINYHDQTLATWAPMQHWDRLLQMVRVPPVPALPALLLSPWCVYCKKQCCRCICRHKH